MEKRAIEPIADIVTAQWRFFETCATRAPAFRRRALERFAAVVDEGKREFFRALTADLRKSAYEGYLSEVGMVLDEIRFFRRRVERWVRRRPAPDAGDPGAGGKSPCIVDKDADLKLSAAASPRASS